MDNLVWNERTKLLASALDRISTACFSVGAIAPLAALTFASSSVGLSPSYLLLAAVCWILFGIGLHLLAHEVLRGLR